MYCSQWIINRHSSSWNGKRIEAGEKEILGGLRNIYHVPEDVIKTFVEPIKIADYFMKR